MLLKVHAGLLVSVLAAGCGPCGTSAPAAPDAGIDASRDAGRDLGPHGGIRDAMRDAIADASIDADAGADPQWTALPEHETGCVIEYARSPQAVYAPSWVPCPDGMPAGCERLDMPSGVFIGASVNDTPMRMIVGVPATTPAGRVIVVASHDRALLAIRAPGPVACYTGFEAAGGGRAVFTTWTDTDDRHYDERHYVVDEVANEWAPPVTRVNRLKASVAQELEMSTAAYVAVVADASKIEMYQDGRSNVLRGLGIPQSTFLVGADVFWEDWGSGYVVRVYHGTIDGPGAVFLEMTDGSDLKSFATDGVHMAWTQGYGDRPDGVTFDRYELWTAPYATDSASLTPRKVLDLEREPTLAAIGDGWYAFSGGDPTELVRLSDGHRKRLPRPADEWDTQVPSFVAGGLLGVSGRRRAPGRFETTLFVVPLDAIPDV